LNRRPYLQQSLQIGAFLFPGVMPDYLRQASKVIKQGGTAQRRPCIRGIYSVYRGAFGCMDFCHDWLVYEKEREDQDEKALA
jgi:hypothetical protein